MVKLMISNALRRSPVLTHEAPFMSHNLPHILLGVLTVASTLAPITLASRSAEACQPEPRTGLITSVLPRSDADTVGVDTHIALRWESASVHRAETLSRFYYYDFETSEQFAEIEFKRDGEIVEIAGNIEIDQEWKELRFSPDDFLAAGTDYEVTVRFSFGDTYTWTFRTMSVRAYSDMIYPDPILERFDLVEEVYPSYTYCEYPSDDLFPCGPPPKEQTGWTYHPSIQVDVSALTAPSKHNYEALRYVLVVHDSSRDEQGTPIYAFDFLPDEPRTSFTVGRDHFTGSNDSDEVCVSVRAQYTYGTTSQLAETRQSFQSQIICKGLDTMRRAERRPAPVLSADNCLGIDPGMTDGGMTDGGMTDGGMTDGGMTDGGGGQTGGGWKLKEEDDTDVTDESGCGCQSTSTRAPGQALLLALFGALLFWRRRRTPSS